ncbi:hypothetical protein [Nocardioides taihuensis]|uniref:DUF998 domain-containing protein n=1 Tax=Nocardioides taihuensis TaxID=1835606 RepID=A0ABW0BEU1_9ACTN
MPPSDVPPVALRTYTALRLGVVAVIAALGIAVWREIVNTPGGCVQRSLSAYYYTPVRPVFVGALLIIGFVMIAMWGKTFVEDAALNLAGMLLSVVALVPTLDANYCSTPQAGQVTDPEAKQIADARLISDNADAVARSFTAFLAVGVVVLLLVAVVGAWLYVRSPAKASRKALLSYLITWALAAAALLVYYLLFQHADDPSSFFNHRVHSWSANLAVACIIVAVASAAVDNARRSDRATRSWWQGYSRWTWLYGILTVTMVGSALVIKGGDRFHWFSGWADVHATFLVEAVLIFLLGVFWVLQTIERRSEGAPTY